MDYWICFCCFFSCLTWFEVRRCSLISIMFFFTLMCGSQFDVTGWVCMWFVSIWSTPSLKLSRIEKPTIWVAKMISCVFCECPENSLPFSIINIISLIFHLQTFLCLWAEAAQHRTHSRSYRWSFVGQPPTAMVFQAQRQRSSTQTASSFEVSNEETMETTEWPLLPMTRPTSSSS